ncbi:MAG: hypothetical protein L0L92_11740, partial [Corynebacterium variabile]|nr:hypothetical protein [Corynebacterium variabile]
IAREYLDMRTVDRDRLGFPTTDFGETHVPGAYTDFDHGVIYWSQSHGAATLYFDKIYDHYRESGFESGKYGFLMEDEKILADGSREAVFENGTLHMDPSGNVTEVQGRIEEKYDSLTQEEKDALGGAKDTGSTRPSPAGTTGWYRNYEHGVIYATTDDGAYILHGPIYDAYREQGFESGPLGFIVSDQVTNSDGTASVEFEGGTLSLNADRTVTNTAA